MTLYKLAIEYLNSAKHYNVKKSLEYILTTYGADTFSDAFEAGGDISFVTVEGWEVFLHRDRIVIAEIYPLPDTPEDHEIGTEVPA